MKSVAIIGAGFSGLVTSKVFKQYGFLVTIFEKESQVGGVWASSRRYPGLTTQNPKDTYHLSDLKMPTSYPEWPMGHQVQQYLNHYAEYCNLKDHIQLDTEVTRTQLLTGSKWLVETRFMKSQKLQVTVFDILIICNGTF